MLNHLIDLLENDDRISGWQVQATSGRCGQRNTPAIAIGQAAAIVDRSTGIRLPRPP